MLISKEFILCVIFTIFGTGTAVIPHIMMNTESKGEISESPHYFKKPHFISLLQFLGRSLVIFLFFIKTIAYKYDSNYPVSTHQSFWSFVLKVTSISVFEVVSTSLMFVSLTCMPLSMWQVLRGTVKIFDFLLTKMFYKKRTVAYQLCGVILTAIGMSAILVEYFISGKASELELATSALFSILAQFIQSCKSLLETKYLVDPSDSTEMIIGVEGIMSSTMSIVIVLPVLNLINGNEGFFSEKVFDTFEMLKNNGLLVALVVVYVILVACYLITSTYIIDIRTKYKSMLGTVRTLLILIISPILNAINSNYGRGFSLLSILFIPGALLILVGTLIFDGVIRIAWFDYPQDSDSGNAGFERMVEEDSPLILQSEVSNA